MGDAFVFAVNIAVEGPTDRIVAERLLWHVNLPLGGVYGERGKGYLLQKLAGYNAAARINPWLVLIDLDQSGPCAPQYLGQILPEPNPLMLLRFPVRAIESWLLADAERLSRFLGVSEARVPLNPDDESNPKATLVNLARASTNSSVRYDMVPRPESGRAVGPGYTGRILDFVTSAPYSWRPEVAAAHSESLNRCLAALQVLRDSAL